MAKSGKRKMNQSQRKTRLYQVVFVVVSIIVLLSMILSLVIN
jgi:hypothetical protein